MNIKDYKKIMKEQEVDKDLFTKLFPPIEGSGCFTHYTSDKLFKDCNVDEIIYIPECTYIEEEYDNVFTKQDFLDITGNEEFAEMLYDECSWQSPSTLFDEYLSNFTDWFIDYDISRVNEEGSIGNYIFYTLFSDEDRNRVIEECNRVNKVNIKHRSKVKENV